MIGNQWRQRIGPSPLCLKRGRLAVLPFPSIPLNFPRERLGAKVWHNKMRNGAPAPKCIFLRTLTSKAIICLLVPDTLPSPRDIPDTLHVGLSPPTQSGVLVRARARACTLVCTRVCVRVWLGGPPREPDLAASVFTHSGRFPAARKMMHSLALRVDCEAKFNLYEGC